MTTDFGVAGSCEEEAREVDHLGDIRISKRQHNLQRGETSFPTRQRHLTAGLRHHLFSKLALKVVAKQ